jgi:hypothetical protein
MKPRNDRASIQRRRETALANRVRQLQAWKDNTMSPSNKDRKNGIDNDDYRSRKIQIAEKDISNLNAKLGLKM